MLYPNKPISIKMTIPRNQQICLESTRTYHCTTRCVRRGFLCGFDEHTQTDYEHRRQWIENRLWQVASAYCIKICSYAIMHNHYHVVIYVDKEQALQLSDIQVIEQWGKIHCISPLMKKAHRQGLLNKAEEIQVQATIKEWRERLYAIDSFMKDINWYIAKRSNKEDGCTGHFWDGRYKSQALLDDKGLLSAMTYVDLNPIRAGIADTPENSQHTSIKERLRSRLKASLLRPCFHPFLNEIKAKQSPYIPLSFEDYLELVDWTGRQIRSGKPGYISSNTLPILERLNLTSSDWLNVTSNLERPRAIMVGSTEKVKALNTKVGRKQISGFRLPD